MRAGPGPSSAAAAWSVWREDDNGNRFRMAAGLHESDALSMAADYTRRGHKQRYWAEPDG